MSNTQIFDENDNDDTIEHESKMSTRMSTRLKISEETRMKLVIGSFATLVTYEILAKKRGYITISHVLTHVSEKFIEGFLEVGKALYVISNQISEIINIEDVCTAIYNIFKPIFLLAYSPYNIITGLIKSGSSAGSKNTIIVIATGLVALITTLALTEIHVSEKYKPSKLINQFRRLLSYVYERVGRYFSDLSSFYRVLRLENFIEGVSNVCVPMINVVVTPCSSTIKGYHREIRKYKYGTQVIGFGSLTLIALICYGRFRTNGLFGYFANK